MWCVKLMVTSFVCYERGFFQWVTSGGVVLNGSVRNRNFEMKKNAWEYRYWTAALAFVDLRDQRPGFLPIGIFTLFLFASDLVMLNPTFLLVVLFVFIAVLQAVQMYGYQFGTISHLTSPCMLLLSLILSVGNRSHLITDISSIAEGCFIPGMAQHVMPSKQGPHVSSFGANWWSPPLQKGKQQNIWKILGLDLDQWSATITFALISYYACFFVGGIYGQRLNLWD